MNRYIFSRTNACTFQSWYPYSIQMELALLSVCYYESFDQLWPTNRLWKQRHIERKRSAKSSYITKKRTRSAHITKALVQPKTVETTFLMIVIVSPFQFCIVLIVLIPISKITEPISLCSILLHLKNQCFHQLCYNSTIQKKK